MKLTIFSLDSRGGAFGKSKRAFTLPELLISVTVFGFLIGGVIFAHLCGLSMFRITETKLKATDNARKTVGKLANEIQTCTETWVGNVGTNGVFLGVSDGENQEGNALVIYPSTDTNKFIVYFVNAFDSTLRRTTSTPSSAVIIAGSITNLIAFRAQDHMGNPLTNSQNNRVIHVVLEFYQAKRFRQMADYYKIETSATRRQTLE